MSTNSVSTARYGRVDPGPGFGKQFDYTVNAVLAASQDGAVITNLGATSAITLTLPPAVAGLEFAIQRVAPYAITMTPDGTDAIASGAPGSSYVINVRGLTVLACSVAGTWEVVIGGNGIEILNIVDYGAHPSKTAAQNTTAIQAAINAGGSDFTLYAPPGTYDHNELSYNGTGGFRLLGSGSKATIFNFVPTADNQIGWDFDRTGTGTTGFCNLEAVQFTTADTSYSKTCLNMVDVAEDTFRDVLINNWYGHKDSVGLATWGRESLLVQGVTIFATVPVYIRKNPDLDDQPSPGNTGWLSADHFRFQRVYFNNGNYRPSTLPRAKVVIEDGSHISQLAFDGAALVGKGHGIYGRVTTATPVYNSGFSVGDVRFEGNTVPTSTASGATTDSAGYAQGATVITLASAGAGALVAGDVIQFAGDSYHYEIASGDADVSGGGTITLASPGLRTAIAASPTAITVTSYDDIHLEFNSSTPLYNASVSDTEFDSGNNAIYARNVENIGVHDSKAFQAGSILKIFDVDGCKSLAWGGLTVSASAGSQAITVDSNLIKQFGVHSPGCGVPHTALYAYRSSAFTYAERGISFINNMNVWAWKGQLADDATLNMPCINANSWDHAEIRARATITGSNVLEYGVWYSAPVTGLTNGIVKASGSTNTAVTDSDTDLCVWNDGSPGDNAYVKNRLGGTAWVSVTVEGARTAET